MYIYWEVCTEKERERGKKRGSQSWRDNSKIDPDTIEINWSCTMRTAAVAAAVYVETLYVVCMGGAPKDHRRTKKRGILFQQQSATKQSAQLLLHSYSVKWTQWAATAAANKNPVRHHLRKSKVRRWRLTDTLYTHSHRVKESVVVVNLKRKTEKKTNSLVCFVLLWFINYYPVFIIYCVFWLGDRVVHWNNNNTCAKECPKSSPVIQICSRRKIVWKSVKWQCCFVFAQSILGVCLSRYNIRVVWMTTVFNTCCCY